MQIVLTIVLFIVGLILTVKGGDWFVDAATWLAEATGIPKFIIGATVVSLATTLPELLVSSIATAQGQVNMAIGNAVGSVNCNTGIILALSFIFLSGVVDLKQFRNKGLLFIIACCVLALISRDGNIKNIDVILMGIIFILYLIDNIRTAGLNKEDSGERPAIEKKVLLKNIALFIGGAVAMAIGAKLMVDNGEKLAIALHVPDILISITLVALGTSLPELVTTITAIRKHQSDISVGNIIGANVLDMTFIVPISGIISSAKGTTLSVDPAYTILHMPFSILVSLIAVIPILLFKKSSRPQGIVLLGLYVAYVVVAAVAF